MSRAQIKDPGETEAYTFDYNDSTDDSLASGETISTSIWSAEHGDATVSSETETTTTTTVTIAGGTLGQVCRFKNTVTTNQGRTLVRRLVVEIAHR